MTNYTEEQQAFIEDNQELWDIVESELTESFEYKKELIENHYCGCYESLEDYAERHIEDYHGNEIPDFLQGYIDYEKLGRDMGFDLITIETGYKEMHIFNRF